MVFMRFVTVFWIVAFGIALFISSCTFEYKEDEIFKDSVLAEDKKDVELQISEATLEKEIQRWMIPQP